MSRKSSLNFKFNENLGKDESANSLLDKALIETFRHCVRIWYDFLYEAILVFRADFGAWTKRWEVHCTCPT
jgi:hypothetical protein